MEGKCKVMIKRKMKWKDGVMYNVKGVDAQDN